MKRSCPVCGFDIDANADKCPDCGRRLSAAVAGPAAQPAAAASPAQGGVQRDTRCDGCNSKSRPGALICERCDFPLPLMPGTLLQSPDHEYRLVKRLNFGGFGAVYTAVNTANNVTVAVKEMIGNNPAERDLRYKLFEREAKILEEAQQFRVVPKFYDFFRMSQDDAYLVLEFVEGADLLRTMEKTGKPFTVDQVIDWAIQICDVLDWMHKRSPPMVHRDLKPDNIMLLPGGRDIKMIDFGTARATEAPKPGSAGTVIFTPGYAPPEQEVGRAVTRSDLFALAVTMHYLLSNDPPIGQGTSRLDPAVAPKWLDELIQINTNLDIHERYITADDFREDLKQKKITTEILCNGCNRKSPARTPYCVQCGRALNRSIVMCPTPQCGVQNVAGSRYCIKDGTKLTQ